MRKTLSTLVALGLVFGAFGAAPAEAKGKKKERKVAFEYMCPCTGMIQLGSLFGGDPNLGGGPMAVGGTETYLTGEAVDQSGQAVMVSINQDVDGDGFNDGVGSFCTKTEEPIAIEPGLEIRVFIGGLCDDGTPTAPIGGVINFTLSNKP